MMVTARSAPIRDGSPDVLIDPEGLHVLQPAGLADAGLGLGLDRVPAGVPVHAQDGGPAPRPWCRRSASASVAHRTARTVSTARGGAMSWVSVNVPVGHAGSRQRQIRSSHRTSVTRPKHGASCSIRDRRPWPTATTPQPGQPASTLSDSTVRTSRPQSSSSTSSTCMTGNIEDRIGSGTPARTRATHRVRHRRGLRRTGAWSPLILKAPTPLTRPSTRHSPTPSHHRSIPKRFPNGCQGRKWS